MILKSINPLTGKKIKEYKCFSENKVNSLINNVYDNYQLWKNISIEKRSELLLSVGKNEVNSTELALIAVEKK